MTQGQPKYGRKPEANAITKTGTRHDVMFSAEDEQLVAFLMALPSTKNFTSLILRLIRDEASRLGYTTNATPYITTQDGDIQ